MLDNSPIVSGHIYDEMADREGFEPSGHFTTPASLANLCLRPLGHLSILGALGRIRTCMYPLAFSAFEAQRHTSALKFLAAVYIAHQLLMYLNYLINTLLQTSDLPSYDLRIEPGFWVTVHTQEYWCKV